MQNDLMENGEKPRHGERPIDEETSAARMQKVREYELKALSRKNSLKAVLGTVNSDLMRIALQLGESIARSLAHNPETMTGVLPSIETQLRLTRQIDRLAQLEMKSRATAKSAGNQPAGAARVEATSSEVSRV